MQKRLYYRITDPKSIDFDELNRILELSQTVTVQFVKATAYNENLLKDLNLVCRQFGTRVNVRFFGHYAGEFDCRYLVCRPNQSGLNFS